MKRALVWAAALMMLAAGCHQDNFSFEMTARDDTIHRTLTVWRTGGTRTVIAGKPQQDDPPPIPDEVLTKIGRAYPEKARKTDDGKHVVTGRFKGNMPDDVGGSGSFARLTSRMGDVTEYLERFGGNDDVAAYLQEQLKQTDRVVDLLIGWMSHEFADSKDWPKIRAFLDKDLRRDLKNLPAYGILAQSAKRRQGDEEADDQDSALLSGPSHVHVRMLQYFTERGYLRPGDSIHFDSVFADDAGDAARAIALRIVTDKAGVKDQAVINKIDAWFKDGETSQESLERYLVTTEAYKAKLAAWEKAATTRPALAVSDKPEPMSVLEDEMKGFDVGGMLDFNLFGGSTVLSVSFKGEGVLISTNGRIDEKTGTVHWVGPLDREQTPGRLSKICYALFARPDEVFQKRHFGKVVLEGEALKKYVAWRTRLGADDAKRWDAFIDTLKPGPTLQGKLTVFRFEDEQTSEAATQPAGRSQDVVEWILDGLGDKQPTTAPST